MQGRTQRFKRLNFFNRIGWSLFQILRFTNKFVQQLQGRLISTCTREQLNYTQFHNSQRASFHWIQVSLKWCSKVGIVRLEDWIHFNGSLFFSLSLCVRKSSSLCLCTPCACSSGRRFFVGSWIFDTCERCARCVCDTDSGRAVAGRSTSANRTSKAVWLAEDKHPHMLVYYSMISTPGKPVLDFSTGSPLTTGGREVCELSKENGRLLAIGLPSTGCIFFIEKVFRKAPDYCQAHTTVTTSKSETFY